MGLLLRVITGIQPVFTFMGALWSAFPLAVRITVALFFAVAVGLVMIRNFVLQGGFTMITALGYSLEWIPFVLRIPLMALLSILVLIVLIKLVQGVLSIISAILSFITSWI